MKSLALGLMPHGATPETHLAAGPWCFCGQEKEFPGWEHAFTFAPEPLAEPDALATACKAAQALCLKMLPVAAKLLLPDAASMPKQYWQILLAPWLMDLASQIVDRSLRSQGMIRAWGSEQLQVALLPQECEFNFADEQDFTLRGSLGASFNHWLFSRLLLTNWPATWHRIELTPEKAKSAPSRGLWSRLIACPISRDATFPRFKGMSVIETARFNLALNHKCKTPDHSLDLDEAFHFPEALAQITLLPDLAQLVTTCLPGSIRALKHRPIVADKQAPRLKIASIASHEDAELRQKLAIWRCQGNRIGHVQHGANYGQVATPCTAAVTEYSQDIFFTWGWRAQGQVRGNFRPMPALQLDGLADSWRMGSNLIFIGTEMPVYGRRLDSHPTPMQYLEYRQAKADFFSALGDDIQTNSLYRPYFAVPGTLADADWLLPQFPGLKLCKGELLPQIKRCRLLVIDHHGTTLLEAMAANIPVIAYWNSKYWPLSPEYDILIELLAYAGIWHATPQKAADKVREIWADPAKWQNSETIQLARRVFCHNQTRTSANTAAEWLKTLENI